MAQLMAAADLAIGAGGTATWERCSVGLPCVTVAVASNQVQLVQDAADLGIIYAPEIGGRDVDALARHLRSLLENPSLLSHMSKKSLEAVDVYGARRVACSMRILSVCVRVAGPDDLKNLYEWRNNPFVRMGSRSIDAIEWSAHVEWFESVKSCPDRLLLIGEERGSPVGVVRFDITKDAAEVSVYLTPGNSGRSLGFDLLAAAEYWLSENRKDVQFLDAEVLGENVPSRRLFSKARYAVNKTSYRKRIDA
jgi:RimJ/RimL family protein N-acetyltransferase